MTANGKTTVALDVMGADGGPEAIIKGGLEAATRLGDQLHVVFVGDQNQIKRFLKTVPELPGNTSVEHAAKTVPMNATATDGVRMRDSSISVGLKLVKKNTAQAFISPGNTGAVMATSLLTLGRIEGVSRPAITAVFPTSTGRPTVLLDAGANADCKPHHLSQFAVMGSVYSSVVFHNESPRVGLVSIGEERSKGNDLIFSAQNLLKESKINFVGNIEGRDILSGTIDVAITDGFTGNILLKFAESIQPMMFRAVRRQIQTNIFSRFGVFLLLPFLRRMNSAFDYAEAGGAPLLGVNGIVVICHGSSSDRAICNAIVVAHEMSVKKVRERIHDELITNHFGKNNDGKDESPNNRDRVVYSAASDD
jgi:glycerol-3-phosphate acyltransferase PlsX